MRISVLLLLLPLVATSAEFKCPSKEEMQARFDAAVSAADCMTVAALHLIPGTKSRRPEAKYVPIWKSTAVSEIASLSKHVRISPPPPSKVIVDGREKIRGASLGGWADFRLTLSKSDTVLLTMAFWEHHVACDGFGEIGVVGIDGDALAPFYAGVLHRIKAAKANQTSEPTATGVTPPAGAGDRAAGSRGSP